MYNKEKGGNMEKQRLSFDMDIEDHKYLKMCCAKIGVSIKDFVINATNEAVYSHEDEWLFKNSYENNDGPNHIYIDHNGKVNEI